jgi:hypothetical protein
LLKSLQEIQPDFVEEAKAYAGLWSQGKKKSVLLVSFLNLDTITLLVFEMLLIFAIPGLVSSFYLRRGRSLSHVI